VEATGEELREFFAVVLPHLNEVQRRVVAGSMAKMLGRGGKTAVAEASGISRNTVAKGQGEVEAGIEPSERLRAPGGGDKPAIEKQPGLLEDLDELVWPETRGHPMSPLRWTLTSTYRLAELRRVIGWSVAAHMRTQLVADALSMAVATRGGTVDGVVFHSDRGSQYTSAEFGELCDRFGVVQSMGATGVCWDNAAAESFFGTLKRELANRRRWATRADARRDLIRWIEGWFNTRRLHSSIDYRPPVEFEDLYYRRGDGIAA